MVDGDSVVCESWKLPNNGQRKCESFTLTQALKRLKGKEETIYLTSNAPLEWSTCLEKRSLVDSKGQDLVNREMINDLILSPDSPLPLLVPPSTPYQ